MADCSKLSNLTPYETYRCFIEAEDWKIIGRNVNKMWGDFSGTTNGEWFAIIFGFAIIPAVFASYIFPFYFMARLFSTIRRRGVISVGRKEEARKSVWGIYLIVAGCLMVVFSNREAFMIYQGGWEILCGVVIFFLTPSWWAPAENFRTVDARPGQRANR